MNDAPSHPNVRIIDDNPLLSLWGMIQRRKILGVSVAILILTFFIVYIWFTPRLYQTTLKLLVLSSSTDTTQLTALSALGLNNNSDQSLGNLAQTFYARPLVEKAIKRLEESQFYADNLSVRKVLKNITVTPLKNTSILQVDYTDQIPERAKALLDILQVEITDNSKGVQQDQLNQAIDLAKRQLPIAEKGLNQSASNLRAFQEKYQLTTPEAYGQSLSEVQSLLEKQKIQNNILNNKISQEIAQYRTQLSDLGMDPEEGLSLSVLSQDTSLQKLIAQLQDIEIKLAIEDARFKNDSPNVAALRASKMNLLQLIQEQAKQYANNQMGIFANDAGETQFPQVIQDALIPAVSQPILPTPFPQNKLGGELTSVPPGGTLQTITQELFSAQVELVTQLAEQKGIEASLVEINRELAQIPFLQQEFDRLQLEYKLDADQLTALSQKTRDLETTFAQQTAPIITIEYAVLPEDFIYPNIPQSLFLALLASLIVGLVSVFAAEKIEDKVYTLADARSLSEIPILGVIGKNESRESGDSRRNTQRNFNVLGNVKKSNNKDLSVSLDPLNAFASTQSVLEFKGTAMNLLSICKEEALKTIAFTSPIENESKKKISLPYFLALAIAGVGKRVLVIDANFVKPRIHEQIKASNGYGFSDILDFNSFWQKAIITIIPEKLDVICSGSGLTAFDLFSAPERLNELFGIWVTTYDFIFVDGSPVFSGPDDLIFNDCFDGLVFSLELGQSRIKDLKNSLQRIKDNNPIGMVVCLDH